MATDPVTLATRWFEEVWNEGRLETVDELMGPGCVMHDASVASQEVSDPAEFKALVETYRRAIPDIHYEIVEAFGEGDRCVLRIVITGTHSGEGLEVAPTQRPLRVTGMALGHWREGRLVEGWNNFDLLSFYAQIGRIERPKV